MALAPGTRLGPYEIGAQIGVGGMGVVYRATDTNLKRPVAIKVLPDALASDAERLARFQREAEVLASLNHPNIAAIYGLERTDTTTALVLELVEGPTLADRLTGGRIPIDEAFPIARQICEALEAAHEHGIIHRDLKPANIKLRPDGVVKVLDFGLAKALATESSVSNAGLSNSPTITSPVAMTGVGVLLGTAAYMSPEQAKGKPADKRSDLWAFGCVLYEMLTGRRAFEGEDVSDTLAAVLRGEPDWSALPLATPAPIRHLLRHCLAKNSKGRIGDASIARIEIDDVQNDPQGVQSVANRRVHLTWAAALALVTLTAAAALIWTFQPGFMPSSRLARFTITLPMGQQFSGPGHRTVALSPDGDAIVYTANGQLHMRALDQLAAVPIRGTEGTENRAGRSPFFSADGQWIGFWQDDQFKKVSIAGGAPVVLCSARNPWGVSWTAENTIFYGQGAQGIWRVSGDGGKPEQVVKVDTSQIASGPQLLPSGHAILFTLVRATEPDAPQIVVQSLDTGMRRVVVEGGTDARYVPTGHLVYALENSLMAVPFDVAALAVTGGPVSLVEDVATGSDGVLAHFSVSNDGALVYVPTDAVGEFARRMLVWVDRQGRETPINAPRRRYVYPRLSPDGTRIALDVRDQENDIWIFDLARESLTRLTFGPARDVDPLWTPDGKSVIYSSGGGLAGARNLFRRAADGTGTVEPLTQGTAGMFPSAITADGHALIFQEGRPAGGTAADRGDLMLLPLVGERRPQPLVQTAFREMNAEISPNGHWLAYQSNESGQEEIYVLPFPKVTAGGKWQVSTSSGGTRPLWARNGRELFYESMGALMRVSVAGTSTLQAGPPSKLFDAGSFLRGAPADRPYDVSTDGRFLMIKEGSAVDEPAASARLVLVLNWFEELKRRVPTN
jgi:Tol biopolymer transport system component